MTEEALAAAQEAAEALRSEMRRILYYTEEGERCLSLLKENRRIYRVLCHCPAEFDPLADFLEADFEMLEGELNFFEGELQVMAPANALNLRRKIAEL